VTSGTGSRARAAPRSWRPPGTLGRGLAGVAVFLVLAEAVTRAGLVDPVYLPPASQVLARTVGLLGDAGFLRQVLATLSAWALGLALAVAVAVPLGVALGSSRVAYGASRMLVEFLRPIPSVALVPLAILLFGQGLTMKVALIVYASLWPILFNTIYGIHDVDPVAVDTARSFGFGRLSILGRVALPSAAPFLATGVRVAAAIALVLAISAELLAGGDSGVGAWMLVAGSGGGANDLVYAATVVTGLLGVAINLLFVRLERRLLAWQPALREAG
jgi:NitT/TauT family transport system permease protein